MYNVASGQSSHQDGEKWVPNYNKAVNLMVSRLASSTNAIACSQGSSDVSSVSCQASSPKTNV